MIGKVTVWYMTDEEKQAYIKKYPIKNTKKAKKYKNTKRINTEKDTVERGNRGRKSRWGTVGV